MDDDDVIQNRELLRLVKAKFNILRTKGGSIGEGFYAIHCSIDCRELSNPLT